MSTPDELVAGGIVSQDFGHKAAWTAERSMWCCLQEDADSGCAGIMLISLLKKSGLIPFTTTTKQNKTHKNEVKVVKEP